MMWITVSQFNEFSWKSLWVLFSLQGGMEETFCGKCHEYDLWYPSGDEAKDAWSYIFTSPRLVKNKENLIFILFYWKFQYITFRYSNKPEIKTEIRVS
jgi:hypothetical protein